MEPNMTNTMSYGDFHDSLERGDWSVYSWDTRRQQWILCYADVQLEFALTNALKWKREGQTVRIDSASNLL